MFGKRSRERDKDAVAKKTLTSSMCVIFADSAPDCHQTLYVHLRLSHRRGRKTFPRGTRSSWDCSMASSKKLEAPRDSARSDTLHVVELTTIVSSSGCHIEHQNERKSSHKIACSGILGSSMARVTWHDMTKTSQQNSFCIECFLADQNLCTQFICNTLFL